MRILVTGAAGFIGSHVAEAFQRAGHDVLGVDNFRTGKRENLPASFPLREIDLVEESQLENVFREFQPEVISHHAAQVNVPASWERPQEDARINILGSLSVLRLARDTKVKRILYSSSGGALYGEPERLPVGEDDPIRPLSNYGVSKYVVELYLQSFRASGGPPYVALRYPNVYGPRQDAHGEAGVVAIFTSQLLRGERPRIFGDGTKTRDYVFVDDVVDANLRALEADVSGAFNLGWGKEITDLEVFQTVRAAVGSSVEPIFDQKRPGEIEHIALDARRARKRLGWKPRVEFPEGVRRVVAYWRGQRRAGGDKR